MNNIVKAAATVIIPVGGFLTAQADVGSPVSEAQAADLRGGGGCPGVAAPDCEAKCGVDSCYENTSTPTFENYVASNYLYCGGNSSCSRFGYTIKNCSY